MATDAALEISRLTAEMVEAEAADIDDHFAGLDDDNNKLGANELVIDDCYIFMAQ